MLVTEILTSPSSWEETDSHSKQVEYMMTIGGRVYEVLFTREPVDHADPLWAALHTPNTVTHAWQLAFAPYRVASKDGAGQYSAYGVTNSGNAIDVFATLVDVVRDFSRKHPDRLIVFTAKEPSRRRLYDRLVKRISAQYQIADVDGMRYYAMVAR